MKHLPNIVTLIRILCSPIIVIFLVLAAKSIELSTTYSVWAFWIYTIAASTDWVDGALARALDAKSELGAKLDLWADKLLVGLSILGIIIAGVLITPNNWLLLTIIGAFLLAATSLRDYIVTDIRAKGAKFGLSMPATFLAKAKTMVVMFGIGLYLGGQAFQLNLVTLSGWVVTIIGAIMSLVTGLQYYKHYLSGLTAKKN